MSAFYRIEHQDEERVVIQTAQRIHAPGYTLDWNVWEPGQAGWVKESGDQPAEWVQPTGTVGMYSKGDRVTYQGSVWVSDVDNNVWQPGVYGWTKEA